jgi:photosystem II stability/assembly factor-like uncharacterized protein
MIASLLPFSAGSAGAANLLWSRVNIPSDGAGGRWVLAAGSDIRLLTPAADGTLYCYANPAGTSFRLFKSTDGGRGWSYTGQVINEIVDIAVIPDDANCIYYATASQVYRSIDAGISFSPLPASPGGAGSNGKEITSIDAIQADGHHYVAAGIRDAGEREFGGVFVWQEGGPSIWQDTGIGNYDVCCVAFSPGFESDRQITAVVSNEADTLIKTGIYGSGWNLNAGDARISGVVPLTAAIAFPADYSSDLSLDRYTQFIALNTGSGKGGLYRLRGRAAPGESVITNLNADSAGSDIASLAVSGSAGQAVILAGAAGSARIFFSKNAGLTWSSGTRLPTGDSITCVAVSPNYVNSRELYAATAGEESAFSISLDEGNTWNQTGLIDTRIMSILDLGVSPDYDQDATLFLVTANIRSSVWRSSDGGEGWERIYCSSPMGEDRIDRVLLSPHYRQNHKVFLARTGYPFIWQSTDDGQQFKTAAPVDPQNGEPVNLYAWAITTGDTLGIGSYNGTNGLVYLTAPGSLEYIRRAGAGQDPVHSLAFSPDYAGDGTILAGNKLGSIFYSTDSGRVFEPLHNPDRPGTPLAGRVSVAFDSDYGRSRTVYAAGDISN